MLDALAQWRLEIRVTVVFDQHIVEGFRCEILKLM
jgi:hypothetical protein